MDSLHRSNRSVLLCHLISAILILLPHNDTILSIVHSEVGGDSFKFKDIPKLSDYIVKKLKDFIARKFVDPSCHR
jgi:hypothetical protein